MLDSDLLSPARILAGVKLNSKKRLFEFISTALARKNPELSSREIFQSICARERLGSTALGNGIAVPHGRISGSEEVQALFLQLIKPLPYDAEDSQPVDLIFALTVPKNCTSDHRKLLSDIVERFSDTDLLEQLRQSADVNEIWHLLSGSHT